MRRILTGLVLILMWSGGAAAGQFEEGGLAFQSGDYKTALRLWRPLAEQGKALAQVNLGVMYTEGRGVPQDDAEAIKWYRLAAAQGDAFAQFNLGIMYANGRGVPQDDAEAVKWFRLAAEQGNASAQYNLGVMYGKGRGVPQDYVQAHMWFNLAASLLTATEAEKRDHAVRNRDIATSKMTPEQIAEAQKLAREWKPK